MATSLDLRLVVTGKKGSFKYSLDAYRYMALSDWELAWYTQIQIVPPGSITAIYTPLLNERRSTKRV